MTRGGEGGGGGLGGGGGWRWRSLWFTWSHSPPPPPGVSDMGFLLADLQPGGTGMYCQKIGLGGGPVLYPLQFFS